MNHEPCVIPECFLSVTRTLLGSLLLGYLNCGIFIHPNSLRKKRPTEIEEGSLGGVVSLQKQTNKNGHFIEVLQDSCTRGVISQIQIERVPFLGTREPERET